MSNEAPARGVLKGESYVAPRIDPKRCNCVRANVGVRFARDSQRDVVRVRREPCRWCSPHFTSVALVEESAKT